MSCFKIDLNQILQLINNIEEKINDLSPVLSSFSANIEKNISENFSQGNPNWPALSPTTLKSKQGSSKMLVNSGALKNSIRTNIKPDGIILGAYKAYAAIQHYGGYACKGRKTKIPARPFLSLTSRNLGDIKNSIAGYLLS